MLTGIRECIKCDELSKYFYNNNCYSTCPKGTIKQENYECLQCSNLYYNGECVDECPFGYVDDNKICITCKEKSILSIYYLEGQCVDITKCKANSVFIENNICYKCEQGKFEFNGECRDKCPDDTISTDNNICIYCLLIHPKVYDNKCYSKCLEHTIEEQTNVCVFCDGYIYNNKCYERCPDGTTENDDKLICEKCPSYYNKNICYDICPEYSIIEDEKNECFSNPLSSSCPDGTFDIITDTINFCSKCTES